LIEAGGEMLAYHDAEDTLFHLTGIFSTEDNHFHALKVDLNRSGAGHAGSETVGRELTSIVDDEVRFTPVGEFFLGWADKHVVL
jgi:hypothetical protein